MLYRKRELARRRHEHGGIARFRYSDMKEAARFAADAGAMQIQLREEEVWRPPEDHRLSTATNGERERTDKCPCRDDALRQPEDICNGIRHSNTECRETCRSFVMEKVISCGNGILSRWGTELDLSWGESFNHHHRAGTLGASPEIAETIARDRWSVIWCGVEQL